MGRKICYISFTVYLWMASFLLLFSMLLPRIQVIAYVILVHLFLCLRFSFFSVSESDFIFHGSLLLSHVHCGRERQTSTRSVWTKSKSNPMIIWKPKKESYIHSSNIQLTMKCYGQLRKAKPPFQKRHCIVSHLFVLMTRTDLNWI